MAEDEMAELLRRISENIVSIKRYCRFLARDAISTMLREVATTSERQQMWRLADGTLSNEQIANQIGVTLRSVQYFVQEAENAGLILIEKRGYPKRIDDVVPSEWKAWKSKQAKVEQQPKPQETIEKEGEPNVEG
jgi:DNA-binding transcriptional regulator LsrR (DeoR family)